MFDSKDQAILSRVEQAHEAGRQLIQWWEQTDSAETCSERFQLTREFNDTGTSFGFYDHVNIGGDRVPVMGEVEDRLFDHPKSANIDQFRIELREFVLRYLMRVSDFRKPDNYTGPSASPDQPDGQSSGAGWCTDRDAERKGFGYGQHYYKLRGTGEIGKFGPEERYNIIDLRELGKTYEWIVLRVRIFDFSILFRPLGSELPQFSVPLAEDSYLVLSSEFIDDEMQPEEQPEEDHDGRKLIGRFGFGYAFIESPSESLLGYGPGQFEHAFQRIRFRIYSDGETRVRLSFCANRPRQITNVPFAPFDWGAALLNTASLGLAAPLLDPIRKILVRFPFRIGSLDPLSIGVDLANLVSGGMASRKYCISREQLEKIFLLQHFDQHYEMISGAMQTWRQIPDWTNSSALPDWVHSGVSS